MPAEQDWLTGWEEDVGASVVQELEAAIPDTRGWTVGYVYEHQGQGTLERTIGVSAVMNSGRMIEATPRWVLLLNDSRGVDRVETWHDRGTVGGILLALGRTP